MQHKSIHSNGAKKFSFKQLKKLLYNPLYNIPNINDSIFLPLSFKCSFFIIVLFFLFSSISLSLSMKHEQTHILCQPLPTTTTTTRKLKTTTTNATHNSPKSKPQPKLNHKPTTPISQTSIQPCHNHPLPQP